MFASSFDAAAGALVGAFGAPHRDEDFARSIACIVEADALQVAARKPLACMLITTADTPQPAPIWRKRMAEANRSLSCVRYHFAIVTPNALQRGVLTAILWLTSAPKDHFYAAYGSCEDAALWLQTESGVDQAVFERLRAIVQAEISRASHYDEHGS